jgi:hypothetical protein
MKRDEREPKIVPPTTTPRDVKYGMKKILNIFINIKPPHIFICLSNLKYLMCNFYLLSLAIIIRYRGEKYV